MRAEILPLIALTFVVLGCSNRGMAQDFERATSPPALPRNYPPFSRVGISLYAGLGGAGVDLATPLARKFNIRAGEEYFSYSTTFQDQGADVAIQLRMQSGHASLDWLPFGGGFRLSPMAVFANDNRARATALVPPGSTITLNGQDYISSADRPAARSRIGRFPKSLARLYAGLGQHRPAHQQPLQLSGRSWLLLRRPAWIKSFLYRKRMRSHATGRDWVRVSEPGRQLSAEFVPVHRA